MTQSQLLGKAGDLKIGEGDRKRLRISVPHFDNSEIIKNYSKTLIGRCMNPKEQNMAALVTNLPKIWNMENRAVGADLGMGSSNSILIWKKISRRCSRTNRIFRLLDDSTSPVAAKEVTKLSL